MKCSIHGICIDRKKYIGRMLCPCVKPSYTPRAGDELMTKWGTWKETGGKLLIIDLILETKVQKLHQEIYILAQELI